MDSREWDGYRTVSDTDNSHSENTNCYEIFNERCGTVDIIADFVFVGKDIES